jgi:hypothetical protein
MRCSKQNNNALRNRPGIGYLTNPKRPTGLEWTCIGTAEAPSAHIHTSFQLQKLIESKTIDWATTKDWTNQHIQLSQHEWDNLDIRKIAYHSTILTNGYLFQSSRQKDACQNARPSSTPGRHNAKHLVTKNLLSHSYQRIRNQYHSG